MTDSPVQEPATSRTRGVHWPSVRILVEFLLDIAEAARNGGSILDVLIIIVVVEANLAELAADPELQRRYTDLASPPPDALRRPVNVSAIAASVGLPYETVRRRLVRLARLGACEIGRNGVVVPTARLSSPEYVRIAIAQYERTRRFYDELLEVGALPDPPGGRGEVGGEAQDSGEAPVRLCNRLLSEYYLRTLNLLMRRVGDPVDALVLLGVARANMTDLSTEARASVEIPPDIARKAARRRAVAAQLGLPAETVRRRLIELERRGFCRTVQGGVIVELAPLRRREALTLLEENRTNLERFISRLGQEGVLAIWSAERARVAVA